MSGEKDILSRPSLNGEEVRQVNFLSDSAALHFRKYYRQGLRSHIFEILSADDIIKETKGDDIDGMRWYPKAVPKYVLRILRTRFKTVDTVFNEIKKYALLLDYLGPDCIARSNEFIVEYTGTGKGEIVLCGLQEFVEGAILDPWSLFGADPLDTIRRSRFYGKVPGRNWLPVVLDSISIFVRNTRKMITDTGYIPDLAGNGNLVLTKCGKMKLVDINNILKLQKADVISLDDKGYPACDKSMEVLFLLEQKILKTKDLANDTFYGHFLSAERSRRVKQFEARFIENLPTFAAE